MTVVFRADPCSASLSAAVNTNINQATLVDQFIESCRQHAGRMAIAFGGRHITYAELGATSRGVAAGLAARGIRQGDRVALYCANSDAFVAAYQASILAISN